MCQISDPSKQQEEMMKMQQRAYVPRVTIERFSDKEIFNEARKRLNNVPKQIERLQKELAELQQLQKDLNNV